MFSTAALLIVLNVVGTMTETNALSAQAGDGILTYGQQSNVFPQWRAYNQSSDIFGNASNAVTGEVARNMVTRTSPTKQEAISGYVSNTNVLHVMCYNGTTWTEDWTVSVGGGGAQARFDIAYEKTTGDALIVYSRNTATTNEMAYRTKAGANACGSANWSGATNIDATQTTGVVTQIRMDASSLSTSNTIGIAWSDDANKLSAMEWTGTSWGVAEPTAPLTTDLEFITAAGDAPSFDIALEHTSGAMMIVWGEHNAAATCTVASNCIRYVRYTSGSWPATVGLPTANTRATAIDISAHPTSDEIIMASIGFRPSTSLNVLTSAYWSGTTWSVSAARDGSATAATVGIKNVATGWLRSTTNTTTRSIIVYADSSTTSTDLSWVSYSGATGTNETDISLNPAPSGFRWMDIQMDPLKTDQLMYIFSDSNADLFAHRLTMDGSGVFTWSPVGVGANVALETSLGQTTNSPYGFAFWRYIPSVLSVDIVDGANNPVGAPSSSMTTVVAGNTCQTSTGTLGITGQRIRLTNTTAAPAWTLSVAPTGGTTTSWSSGTANYDFNDPSGSPAGCSDGGDADSLAGQLSINPSAGSITPKSGCTSTGVSLGSSSAFNQGTIDAITLMSASSGASMNCYWDLLGASLSQTIPAIQTTGTYSLNMTMTVVAN